MSFVERLQEIRQEQERQKRLEAEQKKKEKEEAMRLKAEEERCLREISKRNEIVLSSIGAKDPLMLVKDKILKGRGVIKQELTKKVMRSCAIEGGVVGADSNYIDAWKLQTFANVRLEVPTKSKRTKGFPKEYDSLAIIANEGTEVMVCREQTDSQKIAKEFNPLLPGKFVPAFHHEGNFNFEKGGWEEEGRWEWGHSLHTVFKSETSAVGTIKVPQNLEDKGVIAKLRSAVEDLIVKTLSERPLGEK